MQIQSPAFQANGNIPAQYTCEGANIAPPLAWSHVPAGTKSLALIVDDPDAPDPAAPTKTWVHWVLFDIPPGATGLAENASAPDGGRKGSNDWGKAGYGGPCPPIGKHRYFFKLYALDTSLDLQEGSTKAQVETAMQGHVLAQTAVMGTYEKMER